MSVAHSTHSDVDKSITGIAGEYLVCADLALQGFRAYRVDGLPYDVVVDYRGRVIRLQVKSTFGLQPNLLTRKKVPSYLWYVRRCGDDSKKLYEPGAFDVLALVALDIRRVAYMRPIGDAATIHIRQPGVEYKVDRRGKHFDDYPFSGVADFL